MSLVSPRSFQSSDKKKTVRDSIRLEYKKKRLEFDAVYSDLQ
nr:MAG TPA: hypothetical protein [Caudoviricetes sp.]